MSEQQGVAHRPQNELQAQSTSTSNNISRKRKSGGFFNEAFNEAFNTCKSALGSVASYISECHHSGIPYTVVDKAMVDSQNTYRKYWENGLHEDEENKVNNNNVTGVAATTTAKTSSSFSYITNGTTTTATSSTKYPNTNNGTQNTLSNPKTALEMREYFMNLAKQQNLDENQQQRDDHASSTKRRKLNDHSSTTTTTSTAITKSSPRTVLDTTTTEEGCVTEATEEDKNDNNNDNNNLSFLEQTLVDIQQMINEKRVRNEEIELHNYATNAPRQFVLSTVRSQLIDTLLSNKGNVNDEVHFKPLLKILSNMYKSSNINICKDQETIQNFLEGSYVLISKPTYKECLGFNNNGDFCYTLGRMSFNMFKPTHLKCSIQSTHNTYKLITVNKSNIINRTGEETNSSVDKEQEGDEGGDNSNDVRQQQLPSYIPSSLKNEILKKHNNNKDLLLCTYDIATSLTIEPPEHVDLVGNESGKDDIVTTRQRALMLVKGYMLPDPNKPNRLTVWFTSGRLAPAILESEEEERKMKQQQQQQQREEEEQTNKSDNNTVVQEHDTAATRRTETNSTTSNNNNYGGFDEWKKIFSNKGSSSNNNNNRETSSWWSQQASNMATRLLLGADIPSGINEDDGSMTYTLHRPIGGHGSTYIDVLYLDRDILITKGNRDTIYVMATSGVTQRYYEMKK